MARHRADDSPARGAAGARRRALTALIVMVAGLGALGEPGAAWAHAAGFPADHDPVNSHNGNGRHNMNFSAVNSPTNMSGTQQVAISISRWSTIQLAFCKRRSNGCHISQNIYGRQ